MPPTIVTVITAAALIFGFATVAAFHVSTRGLWQIMFTLFAVCIAALFIMHLAGVPIPVLS